MQIQKQSKHNHVNFQNYLVIQSQYSYYIKVVYHSDIFFNIILFTQGIHF